MLRLRPYKPCDAGTIVSWCKDEVSMRKWVSDRYEKFPITAEDMNHKYIDCNGDCDEEDNFFPVTAFDESGVVGHLILRFVDKEKKTLRFGFVIVDDSKRGMGYGKEMLKLTIQYAFEILKVEKITLGVFENNSAAYHCYKAAGFRDVLTENGSFLIEIMGEKWRCQELEITKCEFLKNNV
ncbi:MAG: GNAT family N-acetyltransferase [Lachnospiraceae bacterium]|nr:GNAT family N-acetyltransferase [Lachnospiraceae bacterium]